VNCLRERKELGFGIEQKRGDSGGHKRLAKPGLGGGGGGGGGVGGWGVGWGGGGWGGGGGGWVGGGGGGVEESPPVRGVDSKSEKRPESVRTEDLP